MNIILYVIMVFINIRIIMFSLKDHLPSIPFTRPYLSDRDVLSNLGVSINLRVSLFFSLLLLILYHCNKYLQLIILSN